MTNDFQKGVSPDASYTQCLDSTLRSITGSSFGQQSMGGDPSFDPRWKDNCGSGVLQFDLQRLAPWTAISSAVLRVRFEPDVFENTSGNLVLYRLHDPSGTGMWEENENVAEADCETNFPPPMGCSAYKRPTVAWTASGGRITSVVVSAEARLAPHTAKQMEWLSFDVTEDVQAFVQSNSQNLGWFMHSETDDTLRGQLFTSDSSDPAKRPVLEIIYTVPDNRTPTANAGADQTVEDTDLNGVEWISLDGSASVDLDGPITNYTWSVDGLPIATGITAALNFSLGTNEVMLTVWDNEGASDSDTTRIAVITPRTNFPPVLASIGDRTVFTSNTLSITLQATDPNGNELIFTAENLPDGATFESPVFSWRPLGDQVGLHTGIVFRVSDQCGEYDSEEISILVNKVPGVGDLVTNVFQKGVSPDASYTQCLDSTPRSLVGQSFGLQSMGKAPWFSPRWASGCGSGILQFDLQRIAPWTSISSAVLRVRFEPDEYECNPGNLLLYRLHDPSGTGMWEENNNVTEADCETNSSQSMGCMAYKRSNVAWTASGGNISSVVVGAEARLAPHTVKQVEWLSFDVTEDVQAFVQSNSQNLGWFMHSQLDDTLRGKLFTADSTDPAKRPVLEVIYTIPDNHGPIADAGADQKVEDVDQNGSEWISLDGSASVDLDGTITNYTWSIDGFPIATGSPAVVNFSMGTNDVLLTVWDDDGATDSDSTRIAVIAPITNFPPVLAAIGNRTIFTSNSLTITLQATDTNGNELVFTAENLPPGATFESPVFSWTPTGDQVGLYTGIVFQVDDQCGEYDSEMINIQVVVPPEPPPSLMPDRIIPPLPEILKGCVYLEDGDIPEELFLPPTNTLFVATEADGGDDANDGFTIETPFAHLETAIIYANAHPDTPFSIYMRGGTHTFKRTTQYDYLSLSRGNIYLSAWQDEDVIIRPAYWPNYPSNWGDSRAFVAVGPYHNITFANLRFEGWACIFTLGSANNYVTPMSNIVLRNISASEFRHRENNPASLCVFLETAYIAENVYGDGKSIATNFASARFQIEDMILSGCRVSGVNIGLNIGDENDANIKGLRITNSRFTNPVGGAGGNSASDGLAVVNCYKVLIDNCIVENMMDDGIDTKSEHVSVVNCLVRGTGRNAVKFWRSGELINSIIYDCTKINDSALVFGNGNGRLINSIIMKKYVGYVAGFNYGSSVDSYQLEIVNSMFTELLNGMYVYTAYYSIRNNLFDGNQLYLFEGHDASNSFDAYNTAQLNAWPNCSDNITAMPQLFDPDKTNFMSRFGSAAVDAGTTNDVVMPSFDFWGCPRVQGAAPDIGPVEYNSFGVDSDDDGVLDEQEFVAGTSPADRADFLNLNVDTSGHGAQVGLSWFGAASRFYDVQFTTNLHEGWTSIPGAVRIAGHGALLQVENPAPQENQFYFRLNVYTNVP